MAHGKVGYTTGSQFEEESVHIEFTRQAEILSHPCYDGSPVWDTLWVGLLVDEDLRGVDLEIVQEAEDFITHGHPLLLCR